MDQAKGGASTAEDDDLLARLTAKRRQIARARPLPQATLRSMLDDFAVRYAHETTAIEGNTLTLAETQVVLEGITVGGKAVREPLEVLAPAAGMFRPGSRGAYIPRVRVRISLPVVR